MTASPRKLDIRIHDTGLGVRQDNANDPTFRSEIFGAMIRFLRARGWRIGVDPEIRKNFRAISKDRRRGSKGELQATFAISGRSIEINVWSENWPSGHPSGHRYDFDKRAKMPFLTRLRMELEFKKTIEFLRERAALAITDSNQKQRGPHFGGCTALEFVERCYAESWHSDKSLGRPVCRSDYNSRSRDGLHLEHGATVWTTDRKGRVIRGRALYNLNSMWWVVTDPWGLLNQSSHEIWVQQPADLRRKQNQRARRARLEAELADATANMNFARAELLRRILFGDRPVFHIWASDKQLFYRPNFSGYTADRIRAGKYTEEEARREVERVPHELSARRLDGSVHHFAEVAHA